MCNLTAFEILTFDNAISRSLKNLETIQGVTSYLILFFNISVTTRGRRDYGVPDHDIDYDKQADEVTSSADNKYIF